MHAAVFVAAVWVQWLCRCSHVLLWFAAWANPAAKSLPCQCPSVEFHQCLAWQTHSSAVCEPSRLCHVPCMISVKNPQSMFLRGMLSGCCMWAADRQAMLQFQCFACEGGGGYATAQRPTIVALPMALLRSLYYFIHAQSHPVHQGVH